MNQPQRMIMAFALATVFGVVLPGLAAAAEGDGAAGREAYEAAKCNLCHSIATLEIERVTKSEKMAGPDLSGIGAKRDKAWMVAFIRREETTEDGGKHTKPFKGTDEELQAIVDWLTLLVDEAASAEDAPADS